MKTITLIFLLSFQLFAAAQTNNPYSTLKYDKVIMYDFEPSEEKGGSIVESNGQLTKTIHKQVIFDKSTITKLNLKLGDKNSFNLGNRSCFDPHLGFVYYKNSKIVAYITICLSCNVLVSSIDLPAQKGAHNINLEGMSRSFLQFLNQLLKKYNFSHQIKQGSF